MAKIALVGAHGVGKTTLAYAIMKELKKKRLPGELISEIPRKICDLSEIPDFLRRDQNTILRQKLILFFQIVEESQNLSKENSSILICDRSLLDHWIYTKYFFEESLIKDKVLNLYEHLLIKYCRSNYNILFYIPIEFPPEDDGVREDDPQFQRSIDEMIFQHIRLYDLPYITINGSIESRCQQVISKIGDLFSGEYM